MASDVQRWVLCLPCEDLGASHNTDFKRVPSPICRPTGAEGNPRGGEHGSQGLSRAETVCCWKSRAPCPWKCASGVGDNLAEVGVNNTGDPQDGGMTHSFVHVPS